MYAQWWLLWQDMKLKGFLLVYIVKRVVFGDLKKKRLLQFDFSKKFQ